MLVHSRLAAITKLINYFIIEKNYKICMELAYIQIKNNIVLIYLGAYKIWKRDNCVNCKATIYSHNSKETVILL